MVDILPEDTPLWQSMETAALEVLSSYGYAEIRLPIIEPTDLFARSIGEVTDIVEKEMYSFADRNDDSMTLRPEGTAGCVRAVVQHNIAVTPQRLWYMGPMFRYERPQKGRQRQFHQLGVEAFGVATPDQDAELIALLIDTLRDLKLSSDDFVIRLSSRRAWQEFFENCGGKESDAYDFYQIVDKLEREDPAVSGEKLAKLGFSYDRVNDFIEGGQPTDELSAIIGNIEARGLGDFIKVDYRIIRGLAYYTGPVYEAFDKRGKFRAIAGGGRYDHLVNLVSGGKTDLPALGFGMGDVVLAELLKDRGIFPPLGQALDAFVQITDETLRDASLGLVQQLRQGGLATEYPLLKAKPDKQFKRALELKTKWLITLQDDNQATIKNLETRDEQSCAITEVPGLVR